MSRRGEENLTKQTSSDKGLFKEKEKKKV